MTEHAGNPTERKRLSLLPILTSAFLLTMLTAMFLLQGRAYREGWLGRFGLDSIQFPISTADTYWLALHGWLDTALGWFNNSWSIYTSYLPKLMLPLAIFAFVVLAWVWWTDNRNQRDGEARGDADDDTASTRQQRVRQWVAASGWRAWGARALLSLLVSPVSLGVFPLLLFGAGLWLIFLVVLVVVPFEDAGKQAARDFCRQDSSRIARVVLREQHAPQWGYRIECNTTVCAVIRDGRVFIVPVGDVARIELPPLDQAGKQKASVPVAQQLCPAVAAEKAAPT